MRKKTVVFLLLLILFCVPVAAHSGGTDANGGHYDRSTGEYHYHHGYPAHQHTNGVCPYELPSNSAPSSNSPNKDKSKKQEGGGTAGVFIAALTISGAFALGIFVRKHINQDKK